MLNVNDMESTINYEEIPGEITTVDGESDPPDVNGQTDHGSYDNVSATDPLLSPSQTQKPTYASGTSRINIVRMLAISVAYFAFAFALNLLGPTLLNLGAQTNTDIVTSSTLFTWRGVGSLIGCLIWGKVYDTVKPNVIFLTLSLAATIFTGLLPWSCSFLVTSLIFTIQGIVLYGIAVGSNSIVYRMLKEKSGPFIQGLHLFYPVSGLLAPQVVNQFLLLEQRQQHSDVISNITQLVVTPGGYMINNASSILQPPGGAQYNQTSEVTCQPASSMINAYSFNSGLHGLGALMFLVLMFMGEAEGVDTKRVVNTVHEHSSFSVKHVRFLQFLFMLTSVLLSFQEISLDGLLYPFALDYLGMKQTPAALLLTIRFVAYTVGRVVSIFAPRFLSVAPYLFISVVMTTLSTLALSVGLPFQHLLIWVFGTSYCFAISNVFSTQILWAASFFPVTGVFTSAYLIGYSVGSLASPPLVALVSQQFGYMWVWHTLTVLAGLHVLLLLGIYIHTRNHQRRSEMLTGSINADAD